MAEESGGFSLVLFSLVFFLLLCQTSLMELPETCGITAFVCLICQAHLRMNRLGKITLHGFSLPELLLMSLSLAGCQLQTHLLYWGFFPLKDFFLSLTFFMEWLAQLNLPWAVYWWRKESGTGYRQNTKVWLEHRHHSHGSAQPRAATKDSVAGECKQA